MKYLLLALISLGTTAVQAMILPENKLHLEDHILFSGNITESDFYNRTESAIELWRPVARAYGVTLRAETDWRGSTVNAYAEQRGTQWIISMFGGLARRPEITPDGFSLVVCHELGHHFAGYYFFGSGASRKMGVEGSSDYFASQVCAPLLWQNDLAINRSFRATADAATRRECNTAWNNEEQQDLCYRITAAGKSLSHLFWSLGGAGSIPSPGTPNPAQVTSTVTMHPEAQCRMDTYFQGALCNKTADHRIIPGFEQPQLNSINSEVEANRNSCATADGYRRGIRPRCWFKPMVN